jgi:hypothetical protein
MKERTACKRKERRMDGRTMRKERKNEVVLSNEIA